MEENLKIKFNGDFSEIDKMLDKLISSEIDKSGFEISNIISGDFCEHYEIDDVDDFNGWQCDWWANFEYKGIALSVAGCAWYGTISVGFED